MTAEQMAKIAVYRQAVSTAMMCASLLSQFDLAGLLRDIERADAIGPVLDPTLWRDKHKAMAEDAELLRAAEMLAGFASKAAGGGGG